jgi:hypothetical protein
MNTYKAIFVLDHGCSSKTFEAQTPGEALKLAQKYKSKYQFGCNPLSSPYPST